MELIHSKINYRLLKKRIKIKKGTLIGNWKEERDIKEATGVSRKIPGHHIPKKRQDLFLKPTEEVPLFKHPREEENTRERCLGYPIEVPKNTTNQTYGSGNLNSNIFEFISF
jgi:hypothetical protein